jgi:hypothetical protein
VPLAELTEPSAVAPDARAFIGNELAMALTPEPDLSIRRNRARFCIVVTPTIDCFEPSNALDAAVVTSHTPKGYMHKGHGPGRALKVNINQLSKPATSYGLAVEEVVWLMPRLSSIFTSTRRFCARPEGVVLSATASVFP